MSTQQIVDHLIAKAELWLETDSAEIVGNVVGEDREYDLDRNGCTLLEELNIRVQAGDWYWLRWQAVKCYQKALRHDPKCIFAVVRLALLYLSIAGDLEEEEDNELKQRLASDAIQALREAEKIAPTDPTVHFILGHALWCHKNDQEESLKHYRLCYEIEPCFFILPSEYAIFHVESINFWSGVDKQHLHYAGFSQEYPLFFDNRQLSKMYEISIQFPDAALMRLNWLETEATFSASRYKFELAILDTIQETARDPDIGTTNETLLANIGQMKKQAGYKLLQFEYASELESSGNKDGARERYDQFLDSLDCNWINNVSGHWWRVIVEDLHEYSTGMEGLYIESGSPDVVAKFYAEWCRRKPQDLPMWYRRIKLARTLGNHKDAITICRTAIEFHPKDPDLYKELIGLCSDNADLQGLMEALSDGFGVLPDNPAFLSVYWHWQWSLRADIRKALEAKRIALRDLLGKHIWEGMSPISKHGLTTAEYLLENFGHMVDSGFTPASIAIAYCEAWEEEVNHQLTEKIVRRIKRKTGREKKSIKVAKEFTLHLERPSPSQIGRAIAESNDEKNAWADEMLVVVNAVQRESFKVEFPILAVKIAQYRNPTAHAEQLTRTELGELRELLLDKNNGAIARLFKWTGHDR